MSDLIAELNRRNVLRVAAAYIVVGYVMLQVAKVMAVASDIPEVVLTIVTWFLVIAFPVTLGLSWFLEMTPDGVRFSSTMQREDEAGAEKQTASVAVLEANTGVSRTPQAPARGNEAKTTSLAVIPFVVSTDAEDLVASGLVAELSKTLGTISGLKVIGQASSSAFAESGLEPGSIGKLLHTDYVVAGSLSINGDVQNITVRLLRVDSGFQLWSRSISAALDQVFQVQEEIAQSISQEITKKTHPSIGTSDGRGTGDDHAYALFVQGRAMLSRRADSSVDEALRMLHDAVSIDPGFARAWGALAESYSVAPSHTSIPLAEAQMQARQCAEKAISLNPRLAKAHAVLGYINMQHRNYEAMEASLQIALDIDDRDTTTLHNYGVAMLNVGRMERAKHFFQRIYDIDPLLPFGLAGLATCHFNTGNVQMADELVTRVVNLGFKPAYMTMAEVAAARGNMERAAEYIILAMGTGVVRGISEELIANIARGIYIEDEREPARQLVSMYTEQNMDKADSLAPVMCLRLGLPELAFKVFLRNRFAFDTYFYSVLWGPFGKEARNHQMFREAVHELGLLSYWQKHGWAESCAPVGDSGFEVL